MNVVDKPEKRIVFVHILVFKDLENKVFRMADRRQETADIPGQFLVFNIPHAEIDAYAAFLPVLECFKNLPEHFHGKPVIQQSVRPGNIHEFTRGIDFSVLIPQPDQGLVMVDLFPFVVIDSLVIRNDPVVGKRVVDHVHHTVPFQQAFFVQLLLFPVPHIELDVFLEHLQACRVIDGSQGIRRGLINNAENGHNGNIVVLCFKHLLLQLSHVFRESLQGNHVGRNRDRHVPLLQQVGPVFFLG